MGGARSEEKLVGRASGRLGDHINTSVRRASLRKVSTSGFTQGKSSSSWIKAAKCR